MFINYITNLNPHKCTSSLFIKTIVSLDELIINASKRPYIDVNSVGVVWWEGCSVNAVCRAENDEITFRMFIIAYK